MGFSSVTVITQFYHISRTKLAFNKLGVENIYSVHADYLPQPPLAKASISNDTIKLNLSCGAIGCGTCAIAAFNQEEADSMLGLDGEDEFVIYAAPVGVIWNVQKKRLYE